MDEELTTSQSIPKAGGIGSKKISNGEETNARQNDATDVNTKLKLAKDSGQENDQNRL